MSRDYYPNSKIAKCNLGDSFNLNVAATQVLDVLHEKIVFGRWQEVGPYKYWLSRMANVSDEECKEAAVKILKMSKEDFDDIHKKVKKLCKERDDFDNLISDWVGFLETCEGYDVAG